MHQNLSAGEGIILKACSVPPFAREVEWQTQGTQPPPAQAIALPETPPAGLGAAAKALGPGAGKLPGPLGFLRLQQGNKAVLLLHHIRSKGRNEIKDSKASYQILCSNFHKAQGKECKCFWLLPSTPTQ